MDIQEMLDRRIKWKTMDDDESTPSMKLSYGITADDKIVLEAQRIRVFEIVFTTKDSITFLK